MGSDPYFDPERRWNSNARPLPGVASEQPMPHGKGADITELVVADMRERSKAGIEKYGEPLRADNGRDALMDAYQEAVDLVKYLRQEIEDRRIREQRRQNDSEGIHRVAGEVVRPVSQTG